MNHLLVVGFGNTLRGDDGLGPRVAADLSDHRWPDGLKARILSLPQLDIALVAELSAVELAVFVDARNDDDDAPLRVVRALPQAGDAPSSFLGHGTHAMAVGGLLGIVCQWYVRQPHCYLIQPKGYDFCFRENLSEKGRQAAARATQAAAQLVWAHFASTGP